MTAGSAQAGQSGGHGHRPPSLPFSLSLNGRVSFCDEQVSFMQYEEESHKCQLLPETFLAPNLPEDTHGEQRHPPPRGVPSGGGRPLPLPAEAPARGPRRAELVPGPKGRARA